LVCFYDKTHTDLHGLLACAPFICTPAPAGNGDSNLCSTLLLEVLFTTTASTRVLALVVKKLLAPCTWAEEDHRRVGAQLTAYSGMSGLMSAVVISEQKNALMIESMLEVSGPFHSSYQGGLGLSVGKCKRTSADKRLGTLCVMHCEKSRRRDCLVVKLFFFDVIDARPLPPIAQCVITLCCRYMHPPKPGMTTIQIMMESTISPPSTLHKSSSSSS
jgi:hypothetical protein